MHVPVQDIQIVVGAEGKPTAVIVDITTWERILDALEDVEDISLAKEALTAFDAAGGDPDKAGFIPWDKVKAELEKVNDSKK
jgi:hypothetical protein